MRQVRGWRTVAMELTGLCGTVHVLSVRPHRHEGPVRWRLGGLAVRDATTTPAAPPTVPA
ncbi:hypothetical protein LK07_02795 [Streptomyces pluripotens]|uniref:Uncharacterized protein n=1 Tax=Streptomyces pluripotens TaxID=1355015 RepID=A0A221NT36_9ACTN|nr:MULTISPECIES: hypothetical protein [Streptomyces]ARP68877.1 hypothetical protein LK06_001715 [Streptomyces pluripotens]ASN23130.1 hypothetical protein LK07_02795 [Streptomyces pluripotens]MCH0556859.1 hypothetical protein [Streptomyces sp. MUM 16J]